MQFPEHLVHLHLKSTLPVTQKGGHEGLGGGPLHLTPLQPQHPGLPRQPQPANWLSVYFSAKRSSISSFKTWERKSSRASTANANTNKRKSFISI